MASASPSRDVEVEVECPICIEGLTDPVTLDCGHNFCKGCINQYCESWEDLGDLECPVCKAKMKKGRFRSNWQLANIVEKIKLLFLKHGNEDLCVSHKEKLNLFCMDDNALVCVHCERSPEHQLHTVLLLEDAAGEYKSHLEHLKKEREDIQANKETTEKESQELIQQTKKESTKSEAMFSQVQGLVEDIKKHFLGQTDRLEKEIAKRRDEHQDQLSNELASLEGLIQEMEEKCRLPTRELLQDMGDTLQRCEMRERFEIPKAFPPEQKLGTWEFCELIPILESVTKQLKTTVEYRPVPKKANVTLDPETANPHLILSEDCKSVRWGDKVQDIRDNKKRFAECPVVLGCENFKAGRHFWEVAVGTENTWMVGVARSFVWRKNAIEFSPETGIWAVMRREGAYKASTPPYCRCLFPGRVIKRIRVILCCDVGIVAFFDADTSALLHTFSEVSFFGTTLLPFFYVRGEASLSICH